MMNTRVLELLKNPKNIQSEDLRLLKEEINSFPYIQNIRALHLYGVHLFDKENYQKELSTTAAYTTDKKILYQLINGKIEQKNPEKVLESEVIHSIAEEQEQVEKTEEVTNPETRNETPKHDYEAVSEALISPKPEIKEVFVNGERNRILFEGEENFLDEINTEKIDIESTLESGVIITQKYVPSEEKAVETNQFNAEKDFVAAPSEIIINEDKIDSQNISDKIKDENVVSFQKIESFTAEEEEKNGDDQFTAENVPEVAENEKITEDLNIETVINEDKIDSEKTIEKISDESELSFIAIESLKTEQSDQEIEHDSVSFETEEAKVLNTETIIEEDKINSEQEAEKIIDSSELSFHGTDSFLPDVKIESTHSEQKPSTETFKPNLSKHEDEMRRLIEEVEKKMKAQKNDSGKKQDIPEENPNSEISFAETQAFHVVEEQKVAEETVVKIAESIVEETLEEQNSHLDPDIKENPGSEPEQQVHSSWKPMSFESHIPDSFSRNLEIQLESVENTPEVEKTTRSSSEETHSELVVENTSEETGYEIESIKPETVDSTKDDEVPVMNVSFFGNDISSLSVQKEENKPEIKEETQNTVSETENKNSLDSNVPGFINTWQSWLKIDRTEETTKDKTEIKNKAIESFIENNPKISQLKDEVNFVVKEKTDDISHLMTETLANLYIEQKLYTKAINAFQILVNKHPDRKEYFENKIQEIKDSRGKN